ncbi:E3 ubiquitin-protein ligase SH3RF1 isoform X1 [Paramormyrops kingsleyae]|uniref:E3 ubiquitin-protein ligase SH3RF1 n=1 Tax=Paramormyrops kingsleyae TaxID=1676925 RepID=A0A3B3RIT7_9TELE|nr:E3 ubiquitin-protein ligase SH3RF1 isoform X1 [Paramormyrops kingsleyae]XP_023679482.1 E3 ubiquitin-protein ligase SH3RF1 isoform X1 [Paramormyrops kingsleyae]XP_023679483.1 E3 ubiquitin-protein ligase SH3RF1 isoform X1 [Paramormyrops kingsleyae]
MDESALLDLLECPVCLERLDATAKVLPCQHTFCRRCLAGIVASRGELRCPECRTLAPTAVDDLPSNILLVRLLDGIRQRPRRPREQGHGPGQLQRAQAKSTPVRGVPQLPCAKALYNYDGKEPGDLKFSKGDIIILRRQVDENWYHGELAGAHGFFPSSFVQVIKPLPQPPPQCKALYDFELKDKEADKDCLPFSKDDILTVIRRVDENWAEGMLGDKIGIFPISYVEFNSAARQLIELDKPASEAVAEAGSEAGPQRAGEAKKNAKKRHSFTSLSTAGRAAQAPPQRHSMEISGPVLISSSNPTAAARIGELSGGLSCSAPSQVHICTTGLIVTPPPSSPVTTATVFTFPTETSHVSIPVDGLPPPPPPPPQILAIGAAASLVSGQRPAPLASEQGGRQRPTVYAAMFPYSPRKEDELELRKGEMFLVLERCQDGWFKGTSMLTGKIGVFPGNYMAPVARTGTGGTQNKVPVTMCTPAGRGVPLLSPTSSLGPDPSSPIPPGSLPTAVVPAAHIQAGQQAKALMHVSGQMTVNQARNAVRTATGHSQDRPTAAVMPVQVHLPPQSGPTVPSGPSRGAGGVAIGCAAASLTPPNVSAASLDGETTPPRPVPAPVAPGNGVPGNSLTANGSIAANNVLACRLERDSKKEKKGLLKLLSGSSNKKKPRPSPPGSPSLEGEQAASTLFPGAVGPESPPAAEPESSTTSVPSTSSFAPSTESSQRKTAALEAMVPIAPPPRQPCSSLMSVHQDSRPIVCERYRVVVSYPPQSEAELELKEGDIVFVHKKREDGWFKGTLQRNGRTGLFPGSFVDSV